MEPISVVLIEDHDLTRIGLRAGLQQTQTIKVIGEARPGNHGLRLLETMKPDVAIVDIGQISKMGQFILIPYNN